MVARKLVGLDHEIIEQYESGIDGVALSKKHGVGRSVIYRLLRRHGRDVKTIAVSKRVYQFDEFFFDVIDSEQKAYVLGLFYADGYNDQRKGRIRLGSIDLDMLTSVREALKSTHPFQPINHGTGFELTIHSKHMSDTMAEKGGHQAKTFTLTFPTEDMVPRHLHKDFVRGFFDGDGCIVIKGRWHQKIVTFYSTYSFLADLRNNLPVQCCPTIVKLQGCYVLQIARQTEVLKLRDWMYSDASMFLDRKRQRFYL